MQFLVTGEFIDAGPLLPPDQTVNLIENAILPGLEQLAGGIEGKAASGSSGGATLVAGGVFVGERAGVCIVEADSAEQLNQFLLGLAFWGLHKWKVQPLISWRTEVEQVRQMVDQMKAVGQT